ncbi:MAG: hypothetical protein LBJ73_01575 [Rickettsiales bacterium]|jgi:hypothetical protein|nr:hypothetical protein [Rickettsiales bacterium]
MFHLPYHSKLHPKLWRRDGTLRPEAAEIMTRIYKSVMFMLSVYAKVPIDLDADVADVILCGSCVDYFYGRHSDLDMKIVVNAGRYMKKMNEQTYITITKFIRSYFIERYAPHVRGIKMDIGIANKVYDMPNYSLTKGRWNQKPDRWTKEELKYIRHRSKLIYLAMRNSAMRIIRNRNNHWEAKWFYQYIKSRRGLSWEEQWGNRSPFSLAFSCFNRAGFVDKLLAIDEKNVKRLMMNIKCAPA